MNANYKKLDVYVNDQDVVWCRLLPGGYAETLEAVPGKPAILAGMILRVERQRRGSTGKKEWFMTEIVTQRFSRSTLVEFKCFCAYKALAGLVAYRQFACDVWDMPEEGKWGIMEVFHNGEFDLDDLPSDGTIRVIQDGEEEFETEPETCACCGEPLEMSEDSEPAVGSLAIKRL